MLLLLLRCRELFGSWDSDVPVNGFLLYGRGVIELFVRGCAGVAVLVP